MVRVLAVSDEVVASLWTGQVGEHQVDLILGAGDLPFDYLEFLATTLDRPCVFVPGNHDLDLTGYQRKRGLWLRSGFPASWPGPQGGFNVDGQVHDVAGLRIAGLGGSIRYNLGPNQWTEREQARRARKLVRMAERQTKRDGRRVDVLLTHSPPRHLGDREDPPHRGFECLRDTIERLAPTLLVHGHIHPHGERVPDRTCGSTRLINTVGYRILDIPTAEAGHGS